ncbi:rhodanese-like domain-containing protein [Micromonospora parathelypteridis]|uniref:Rhodanese-related sulfurtransferase n=1 Tax=Micromonospora parathelypteridis TaxID=1839617 RepID=A0A840W8V0_9ACTN|nr:rhodanese-like domain-containing protein [Micromonospora parathelypteridis]MBB5479461.1 rhodanese-related sulfurtransferase [Micromonospora parathelypteridis]GGO30066.1 sulfurtransferase [Micromonospora parathelypteridis]
MTFSFAVAPADPATAAAYFRTRLSVETDVSDVHADLSARTPDLVVVDSRGAAAWAQGHLPGAVHLPTAEIVARAAELIPAGSAVVTYCWGPGCNGATRAALEFARLGYPVKEMLGGFEYWVREGLPVVTTSGLTRRPVDDLTAPTATITCDC